MVCEGKASPVVMQTVTATLDLQSKTITTFIAHEVQGRLDEMEIGDVLEVVSDTFEAIAPDIRAWSRMTGHKIKAHQIDGDHQTIQIEKGYDRQVAVPLAMIISDAGLDERCRRSGLPSPGR